MKNSKALIRNSWLDLEFEAIFCERDSSVFFKKWSLKFDWFSVAAVMVDDMAEARDLSGRAEGPTANLTESKNDENLW